MAKHASTSTRITTYYRKHDDFRRYTAANKERMTELARLYRRSERFIGHRVLDLACGGGVLGFVVEPEGHRYVGVDINPDAVDAARHHADEVGSHNRFVLGDVRSTKLAGTFDTVTLLGNALCHFNTADLVSIMRNVSGNVHSGSYFVVDYRDVVSLLFARRWARRFSGKRGTKTVTSVTKGIDTRRGDLLLESVQKGGSNFDFTHGVWSPFVLEPLMELNNWSLVRRNFNRRQSSWFDVYRRL